jgi:DNA-binding IclR family transcriptional regulator
VSKHHLVGSVKRNRTAEEPDNGERYRAPALDKGLDILEALAATEVGLTQAEIAKALDRSPSEIYRMLDRLVRRGYVVRTDAERYELSLKLFALAHQHAPRRRLVSLAIPKMREFVQAAEQSCHLAVFDRGRVIIIAQLDAPTYWGIAIRLGAHVPLLGTGSGHVLLAFQSPAERLMMLAEHEAAIGEQPAPPDLEERLGELRARGYERMPSRQTLGVTNIAAPVLGPDGTAIAAFSCPFVPQADPSRPDIEAAIAHMLRAAGALTELAGGQMLARSDGVRP